MMKLQKTGMTLSLVCAISALGVGGNAALADDDKVYPGALCDSTFGGDFTDGMTDGVTGFSNRSGGSRLATCPIITDDSRNTNGLKRVEVQVVRGSRGQGLLSCAVHSRDEKGKSVDSASDFTAASSPFQLNINDVALSARDGYYVMLCSLPDGARIISYKVLERNAI